MKIMKSKPTELKTLVTEIKNFLGTSDSRFHLAEKRTGELEGKSIEIIQS